MQKIPHKITGQDNIMNSITAVEKLDTSSNMLSEQ